MDGIASIDELNGAEKASIMMLALSEADVARLFGLLDHHEVMEISQTMAVLGRVEASVVEQLLVEFGQRLSRNGGVMGGFDATEKLLLRALDPGRAEAIMQEIRGPAGRTVWDKLAHVNETVLASYLKNEYPQTAAVVLTRIEAAHAARVLTHLPDDFATEVVIRMLRMEVVQREIVADVERTLRAEFMSNLARTNRRDNHELMAEIFNYFDRCDRSPVHHRAGGAQQGDGGPDQGPDVHLRGSGQAGSDRHPDPDALGGNDRITVALKGASEQLRDLFLKNMSERAAKILRDDMQAMGPVRLRDVEEAQQFLVNMAKELAASGEIVLADGKDDELVY